jgi:hypothetical protein
VAEEKFPTMGNEVNPTSLQPLDVSPIIHVSWMASSHESIRNPALTIAIASSQSSVPTLHSRHESYTEPSLSLSPPSSTRSGDDAAGCSKPKTPFGKAPEKSRPAGAYRLMGAASSFTYHGDNAACKSAQSPELRMVETLMAALAQGERISPKDRGSSS